MVHTFDKDYWEQHWGEGQANHGTRRSLDPNPHLVRETEALTPGSALEAGCGEGEEALWLASRGWQVTAADISSEALGRALDRETPSISTAQRVQWVEADLSAWQPGRQFDLVTTHYAHPAMPQRAFYERIARWVAPGGTLLIVGHLHDPRAHNNEHGHEHGHAHGHEHGRAHGDDGRGAEPPPEASVTAAGVCAVLEGWEIITADEPTRTVTGPTGRAKTLRDVVVRATRSSTTP